MNQQKRVEWEKSDGNDRISIRELAAEAVWEAIAILLLIFAAIRLLEPLSYNIELEGRESAVVVITVLLTVFFYEVFVRFWLSKIKKRTVSFFMRMAFALLPALLCGIYMYEYYLDNARDIKKGLAAIATYFLKPYNRIFGSNIVLNNVNYGYLSYSLCFVVLALFFALYFLSFLGKRKWLFLLFPVISISAIMYVGQSPEWMHILLAVTGAFMTAKRSSGKGWIVAAAASVVIFASVSLVSGIVFEPAAEKMLEYSDDVKEFQHKMERNFKTMFSKLFLSSDKVLDNSSPRYKDADIMTVTVNDRINGNLYFKEFYGVDYEKGVWSVSPAEFSDACKDGGMDADEVATVLAMANYDTRTYKKREYKLEYSGVLGQAMLLPYAVNAEDISGLSFKGDFIAKKKLTEKKVTFYGIDTNTFSAANLKERELSRSEEKFWKWYNSYVNDTCLYVPDYIFKTDAYDELSEYRRHRVSEENSWRMEMAERVAEYFSQNYTYSWDLDGIDSDVDPLEYFIKRGKKGYCMHFASAGVILLRSLGVPARYASGYVLKPSMLEKKDDGSYSATVKDRNGHAWVEIYINGVGWIPYEMTPGYDSSTKEFPASEEAQKEREEKEKKEPSPTPTPAPTNTPKPTVTKSADTPSPAVSTSPKNTNTPKPTSVLTQTPKPHEEGSSGSRGGSSGKGNIKPVLIGVFIVMLLSGIVFLFVRAGRRRAGKLEGAIKNKYYRLAVRLMNRRVYKKLKRKGGYTGRLDCDRKLEEALLSALGEEKKAEIKEYMRVVKKAVFSQNGISAGECEAVAGLYRLI